MPLKLKLLTLTLLSQFVLVGCAVEFSQLETIKLMLRSDEKSLETVEWSASWNGRRYALYAADAGSESIYMSGTDIRLYFSNFHFTEVVGLLPNEEIVLIEKGGLEGGEARFSVNDQIIAQHTCEEWQESESLNLSTELDQVRYIQNCRKPDTNERYQNEIDVSSESLITRLKFLIHPEYPPLTISLVN